MTPDELANAAIKHALKSLRKRHLLEEAAHSPAFTALSKPLVTQGSEWKEKAEKFELELQQCYKAQARLSEQLVVEVAECRNSKSLIEEQETKIAALEQELAQTREELIQSKETLEEKTKALDLVMSEKEALKAQLEEVMLKAKNAEAENKMLIDRWMLQKMQDAERMNEINAMYEDMRNQVRASDMEKLARQKVDGIVRQFEVGSESLSLASLPSSCKHKFRAHDGGCGSMLFEHSSSKLISGGQDGTVHLWDSETGMQSSSLHGCLGSVLDLSVTHDNKYIIAASSSKNLYVWEVGSGRVRHTLTGHTDKVCAVDSGKHSGKQAVSAAYDHTMKVWDLNRGYCVNTLMCHSNCNAIIFSMDELTICSGHVDGNIRLWDIKSGKVITQVAAHTLGITSLCLSGTGNIVLTSGRDNVHNIFDIRTLEVCDSLKASGNRVASNWSRSCLSPDDNYVAAGSSDGSVYVWSRLKSNKVTTLSEHTSPILCCSWSEMGLPIKRNTSVRSSGIFILLMLSISIQAQQLIDHII